MLEIIRDKYKKESLSNEAKGILLRQAEKIWKECEKRKLVDNYLITNMMDVYLLYEKNESGLKIYEQYLGKIPYDLPVYSKYAPLIFRIKGIKEAENVLVKMKSMSQPPL